MTETGTRKGNVCGIVGVCIGWLIPIVGFVLGVVALARHEDSVALGVISIVESILFFCIAFTVLVGMS